MTAEQYQTEAGPEEPSENAAIRSWYVALSAVHAGINSGVIFVESNTEQAALKLLRIAPSERDAAAKAVDESSLLEALIIDQALVHRLTEEERESHTPVTELLREGLELVLTRRAGLRGVAEWEAEHGALTEEELKAAAARLFGGDSEKVA